MPTSDRRINMTSIVRSQRTPAIPTAPAYRAVKRLSLAQAMAAVTVLSTLSLNASAASFVIASGTNTSAQSLAAGQTGSVNAGATLSVSGSSVAVTFTGSNASVTNLGSMLQTGTGRLFRDNTGLTGLIVTNGSALNSTALMRSADADVFQMNVAGGSVTLNNYAQMISLNASKGGAQVVDFNAITAGPNTINNFINGVIKATDADAVRPGVSGTVNNYGSILSVVTTDTGSDGIDFQNNSGGTVNNYSTGSITGARHGIAGGALNATVNWTASIANQAGGTITGSNGSGINLDGFNNKQVVTINNAGSIIGNGVSGDGDGIDVDGLVNITNTGTIRSVNSFSAIAGSPGFSEGITVGGGSITNSGLIEGLVASGNTNARGRGITLSGNDITSGPLAGTREGLYGNATVINQAGGLIRGDSDSAIWIEGAASGYTVLIDNQAGATLRGGGTTNAAIVTGADIVTLNNRGTIDGSSSGKALQGGAGAVAVSILGGQASVSGNMDGGTSGNSTLIFSPGAGGTFVYGGAISNFKSLEVQSGQVTLSGISSYAGTSKISGGNLTLDGANRLSSASSLALGGGQLTLANSGGANGQTFSSLLLSDNSSIDLGNSSLTFNALGSIANGKSLTLFDYAVSLSPDYAIRILGDMSGLSDFQALMAGLTINGVGASFRFDSLTGYTNIGAVPLPPSFALFLAGLSVGGLLVKRRVLA
jgi:hypothetical protein